MKFSVATIAALATAATAQYQGYPQTGGYQPAQQPSYQQYPQQYQQYPQQYQSAPQQNKYSPAEAAAWHGCVDQLLDQFNNGHEGTKVACSMWTCLENNASKYNRGGALASIGNAVNLICKGSGILPSWL